jgi:hypothetical protein
MTSPPASALYPLVHKFLAVSYSMLACDRLMSIATMLKCHTLQTTDQLEASILTVRAGVWPGQDSESTGEGVRSEQRRAR